MSCKGVGKLVNGEMESPLTGSGELEAAQRSEFFWGNGSLRLCMCHAPGCLTEGWMKSSRPVVHLAWAACSPTQAGFRRVTICTRTGPIRLAVCPGLYLPEEGAPFQLG